MRQDITSKPLINDLKEVQRVIAGLADKSEDLQTASKQVQTYIDNVHTAESYNDLYDHVRDLSEGMTTVSKVDIRSTCTSIPGRGGSSYVRLVEVIDRSRSVVHE